MIRVFLEEVLHLLYIDLVFNSNNGVNFWENKTDRAIFYPKYGPTIFEKMGHRPLWHLKPFTVNAFVKYCIRNLVLELAEIVKSNS